MTDDTEKKAPPVPANPLVCFDPADTLIEAANVLRAVARFQLEGSLCAFDPENCGLWKILQCVYEALDYESTRFRHECLRGPGHHHGVDGQEEGASDQIE